MTEDKSEVEFTEATLFSQGVYKHDVNRYDEQTVRAVSEARRRFTEEGLTNKQVNDEVEGVRVAREKLGEWLLEFDGLIPNGWSNVDNVLVDIQRAKEHQVDLPEILIDAAVCHPNYRVGLECFEIQLFDVTQLAIHAYSVGKLHDNYLINHQIPFLEADENGRWNRLKKLTDRIKAVK